METLIRVLIWADLVSFYSIWLLMTYLTEVWKSNITRAAGILNIWAGIVLILPMGIHYLLDVFGCFLMLVLSSISYSIGLVFLVMSTPPVTGTCSKYEPECIGDKQKGFFYAALAFLAIGMSGHIVSLRPVLDLNRNEHESGKKRRSRLKMILIILFTAAGGFAIPLINPWWIRFLIPAICTVVATILFTSRVCFYKKGEKERIHRVSIYRSIILPKMAWRMIPIWAAFIICGVVCSAGSTYFQEQANHLNRDIGKWKLPLPILVLLQKLAKLLFSKIIYSWLKTYFKVVEHSRYTPLIGIGGAVIFATLSCVTAAKIEVRRLDIIRSHDLIEKPEDTIPMTIAWMLPQFVLLGGLESCYENSVTDFFSNQSSASVEKYLDYFAHGVSGIGFMGSVLMVYIVGKISERKGDSNWFQDTLNKSRLDNYLWILSASCAVIFILYILVLLLPKNRELTSYNEEQP